VLGALEQLAHLTVAVANDRSSSSRGSARSRARSPAARSAGLSDDDIADIPGLTVSMIRTVPPSTQPEGAVAGWVSPPTGRLHGLGRRRRP
jgi:hypothetical protein